MLFTTALLKTKKFTWHRSGNTLNWSRIDYFLLSQSMANSVIDAQILPGVMTDHSMLSITYQLPGKTRGKGYWKFNNKMLQDEQFKKQMQITLETASKALNHLNPHDKWEAIKFEITQASREYSEQASYASKNHRYHLQKLLSDMQDDLIHYPNDKQLKNSIPKVESELKAIVEKDASEAAFRARATYYEKGEYANRYFFYLEKPNYASKTMYIVRKPNGQLMKDYSEILKIQANFYQNLYKYDPQVQFELQNHTEIKLSEEQCQNLDRSISINEIYDAMMTLKSNKSPGSDSLSIEFFRAFWNQLKTTLFELYTFCFAVKKLNPTARRGIINLIPKPNKDELLVKNWRPITLLNYDYKILAKLIANRFDKVSKYLIGPQQCGFMKGRGAHLNIRKTLEVIASVNRNSKPGVIATIDFEKCFDRIDHKAIAGVLKYFNIGPYFKALIFLLLTDMTLCTQNSGYFSRIFSKERGINQGCPASSFIYLYCGETMAHLLNDRIQGLTVQNIQNILCQFADDTSVFLKFEQIEIDTFCTTLEEVETNMGLKVSYEKTTLYRIGSLYDTNAKLYTTKNFNWSDQPISTLGMHIACDNSYVVENYQAIKTKLIQTTSNWYNKSLTLMGKVVVINTLMSSLFVYKMLVVNLMNDTQYAEAKDIIVRFLWNGKKPKIAYETLVADKSDGGLRLTDLKCKQKSLLAAWVFIIQGETLLQECAFKNLSPDLQDLVWQCSISPKDVTN